LLAEVAPSIKLAFLVAISSPSTSIMAFSLGELASPAVLVLVLVLILVL
jgi:hypothetical protein